MTSNTITLTPQALDSLQRINSYNHERAQKRRRIFKLADDSREKEKRIAAIKIEYEYARGDESTWAHVQIDHMTETAEQNAAEEERLRSEIEKLNADGAKIREELNHELWQILVQSRIGDAGNVASPMAGSFPEPTRSKRADQTVRTHNVPLARKCVSERQYTAPSWRSAATPRLSETDRLLEQMAVAKENRFDARITFDNVEDFCASQKYYYDQGYVDQWRQLSRTEFDGMQLRIKMEITTRLIKADKAYKDLARQVMEAGVDRDDSDQSAYFADRADDRMSNDPDMRGEPAADIRARIDKWLEGVIVEPCSSTESTIIDEREDTWVEFGESTSTHADEDTKARIECQKLRMETARKDLPARSTASSSIDLFDDLAQSSLQLTSSSGACPLTAGKVVIAEDGASKMCNGTSSERSLGTRKRSYSTSFKDEALEPVHRFLRDACASFATILPWEEDEVVS